MRLSIGLLGNAVHIMNLIGHRWNGLNGFTQL